MWCHILWYKCADISEERTAPIFITEAETKQAALQQPTSTRLHYHNPDGFTPHNPRFENLSSHSSSMVERISIDFDLLMNVQNSGYYFIQRPTHNFMYLYILMNSW
jgi:hypothetical protein